MLNSSTSQLRTMLVRHNLAPHTALAKWTNQLGQTTPEEIWLSTWVNYRSAAENTFLWQLIYRIPATQRWRHPDRPATDSATWCTRCTLNVTEDLLHCVWSCPASQRVWQWWEKLLAWVSFGPPGAIRLQPEHVLIAVALPDSWETPCWLWITVGAILCWIVWKDRNSHVFGGDHTNVQRMIALSWHRLSLYVKVAWIELLGKVRLCVGTLTEARDLMAAHFGAMGKI